MPRENPTSSHPNQDVIDAIKAMIANYPKNLEKMVNSVANADEFNETFADDLIIEAREIGREDLAEKLWARELKELEKEIEKGGDEEACCSWAAELAYNIGDMEKHREYQRRADEYIIEDHIDWFESYIGDREKAEKIVKTLIDWGTVYEVKYMVSNYGFTVEEMMAKTPDQIREEFEFYYDIEMEEIIAKSRREISSGSN